MSAEHHDPVAALRDTMQYMGRRDGGLLVDFSAVRNYHQLALDEPPDTRVRVVLHWLTIAAELGLLPPAGVAGIFERSEDLGAFANDLRRLDASLQPAYVRGLRLLGFDVDHEPPSGRHVADWLDAVALSGRAPERSVATPSKLHARARRTLRSTVSPAGLPGAASPLPAREG